VSEGGQNTAPLLDSAIAPTMLVHVSALGTVASYSNKGGNCGGCTNCWRFDCLYRIVRVMRSVIQQSVILSATAEALFAAYLDPAAHAAITGFPVTIGDERGAVFHAFNEQLSGRILAIVRPRLIVQSWRSVKFHDTDPDSTLILMFTPDESNTKHGRIDLVHLDVPEHDYNDVIEGWHKHYWDPWRIYLKTREGT
jgi:uncharacterized protein YndB with AHSA1/START domain